MRRAALVIALIASTALPAPAAIDFDREIRPILSDNCFSCHGPDAAKRMAKLRLDVPDGGVFANGVVTPGHSADSRLFARIAASDAKRMPPVYSGRTLNPQQIELLKQWIDQGAKWQSHWAFIPPHRTDPPAVRNATAVRNPIDNFILARLETEGLQPSPAADKATLLRRLTYDLTGLPPTLPELSAFLADTSANAYEKRVDALLASPKYGERMATPWLDLARYADTHGYHIDSAREMWHWRDWVVNAFNSNMPYSEFTIEQLAGDLMPHATLDQKLASGFNRNHMINFEGGAIPEEYQVEYMIDRLEATSNTWMGLTMGCARCHDHKYDPIAQKDFYRFAAFFNNISEKGLDGRKGNAEPFMPLPSAAQKAREQELKTAIAAHENALPEDVLARRQSEWELALIAGAMPARADALEAHYEFDGSLTDSSGNHRYGRLVHGDISYPSAAVDKGADFDGETHAIFAPLPPARFSIAFWLKVNGKQRESVLRNDDFEIWLDDFELSAIQQRVPRLYARLGQAEIRTEARLPWADNMNHIVVNYDGSGKAAGLGVFVNGKPVKVEALKDVAVVRKPSEAPFEIGDNKGTGTPFKGRLDDLRVYSRPLHPAEIDELQTGEPLRAILNIAPDKRTKEQKSQLRDIYLTGAAHPADRRTWSELKALREDQKQLTAQIPTTMVMSEIVDKPRETFVLARGDYRNQTEKVTPDVPAVLPPLPPSLLQEPANRLTLAKWLVDPANPLTARVAVNRYWQMYFGTGIVKTAENFGSQGDPPSHPELLDWLATEFIRTGWDVKAMQRLIVTSAAYRQSSRVTPALLEKDPENRLLARGPRFRLPAEMIRDGELAIAGLLKENTGGPGVSPYQPKGLWEEIAFGDGYSAQSYTQGHGDDLYRRSLYTFWKRTSPPPSMTTFDAPDREKCSGRRTITNTPLQALALLNDPAYVEAARALAERILTEGGKTPDSRIEYAFRLALARPAAPREAAVLRDTLAAQLVDFKRHEDRAQALLRNGESPVNPKLDRYELAAWTTVAGMILNLDETITKE